MSNNEPDYPDNLFFEPVDEDKPKEDSFNVIPTVDTEGFRVFTVDYVKNGHSVTLCQRKIYEVVTEFAKWLGLNAEPMKAEIVNCPLVDAKEIRVSVGEDELVLPIDTDLLTAEEIRERVINFNNAMQGKGGVESSVDASLVKPQE